MQPKRVGESLSVTTPITVDTVEEVEHEAPAAPVLQQAEQPLPSSGEILSPEDAEAEAEAAAELAAAEALTEAMMEEAASFESNNDSPELQTDPEAERQATPSAMVTAGNNVIQGTSPVVEPKSSTCLAILGYRNYMRAVYLQSPIRPDE